MALSEARPHVSVVILAYNEVSNLRPAVDEMLVELKRLGLTWELLIVDDGSSDGTGALADELALAEPHMRVVHHVTNLGLGGGYRTGFREARGNWLTFFPADGQFPADIVSLFVAKSENADMVLGYLPERKHGLVGKALSFAERVVYRAMFRDLPRFQGIMLFRRTLLDELPLVSEGRGWAIVMELLIRASRGRYRLVSVPTALRPRLSGESKVNNIRSIVANLKQIWQLNQRL